MRGHPVIVSPSQYTFVRQYHHGLRRPTGRRDLHKALFNSSMKPQNKLDVFLMLLGGPSTPISSQSRKQDDIKPPNPLSPSSCTNPRDAIRDPPSQSARTLRAQLPRQHIQPFHSEHRSSKVRVLRPSKKASLFCPRSQKEARSLFSPPAVYYRSTEGDACRRSPFTNNRVDEPKTPVPCRNPSD